MLRSHVVCLAV